MKPQLVRIGSRIALVLALVCAFFAVIPRHAAAYSCTDGGHCYAIVTWNGSTHGAATDIGISYLYASDPLGAFGINNTLWLVDGSGNYWVEGGYKAAYGSQRYYWGDVRPSDPVYRRHDLGAIPGQHYGFGLDLNIVRMPDDASYVVALHVNSVGYSSYNYSVSNTMTPNRIDMGQELSGTASAHADQAQFTYNQWQENNGTYHFQNQYVNPQVFGGPYGYWAEEPQNSSIGGIWATSCGC